MRRALSASLWKESVKCELANEKQAHVKRKMRYSHMSNDE
jgi:hypothetical protein